MDRRRFLMRATVGASLGLAGCSGKVGQSKTTAPAAQGTPSNVALPVAESDLKLGAPRDAIPAITDPAFSNDWSGIEIEIEDPSSEEVQTVEPRLTANHRVIGVEGAGGARAYPLAILHWHEAVNDSFGGDILVTYCPLCSSGVTADRTVNGKVLTFGVSGFLWNPNTDFYLTSNLVLYDVETRSLWSQLMATAIRGQMTGVKLDLLPSMITTWGAWRESYPDTAVLLPPPESNTIVGPNAVFNYTSRPYVEVEPLPSKAEGPPKLHPKTQVIGVAENGESRAYPFPAVREAGIVNDSVGGRPVVVAIAPGETLVAYDRQIRGTTLQFDATRKADRMRGGGSRWAISTGRAVDGPYRGTELTPATNVSSLFLFVWNDFHPDTTIYGNDSSG